MPRSSYWSSPLAASALLLSYSAPALAHLGPGPESDSEVESATEPQPGVGAEPDPSQPDVSAGLPEGLTLPSLLNPIEVDYPDTLANSESPPSGTVKLRFVVMADGSVSELTVTEGVHPEIDEAIAEKVRTATFEPAQFKGQPVEFVMVMPVEVTAPPKPDLLPVTPSPIAEPASDNDPSPQPEITGPVRLSGRILKGGDRAPLDGVQVIALPADGLKPGRVSNKEQRRLAKVTEDPAWSVSATTDEQGRFALRGVPSGNVRLVFVAAGFERFERVVQLPDGQAVDAKYFLTVAQNSQYRTRVDIESPEVEEVTRRSLSAEQLAVLPGSGGDALKGAMNIPGAARTPFGFGGLLLRGAGPQDSVTLIGQHETPLAFHFFGLTSVVPTSMLRSVDVIPSSYDARYGDAIGGIVDVKFRQGRTDRVHGEVFADVINAGAMLEVPVGKGWIMAGARRSYVGNVLAAFDPSFTVAPRYWDYQGLFGYPLGPGELRLRAFGSDDALEGVGDDVDDAFNMRLGFHRADVEYEGAKGDWSFLVSPGYRHITQQARFAANDRISLNVDSGVWRGEATWKPKDWISWQIGTQGDASSYGLGLTSTPFDFEGGETIRSDRQGALVTVAGYSSATFKTKSGFSITPGVRVSYFALPSRRVVADPRLRARWTFSTGTTIKAGGGTYSQAAAPEFWIDDFGNPDIRPERAWHASAGIEQKLPHDFSVEATGFMRGSWDLAMPSDAVRVENGETIPVNAENTGSGRAYGGEFMIKRDFSKNISGWIAYTLMRSELRENSRAPFELADWDQTHNLIFLAHWRLPKNWAVGARFRLTSGNLTTPISDGVFDSRSGEYSPLEGPRNSDRLPLFHQLDLRVDKTWTVRAVNIGAYLDVQNIYNARNTEFREYGFDYKRSVRVRSLPILPSLGVKVSF